MGSSAVAPPRSTANRSSEIVPSIARLRLTKATPAKSDLASAASALTARIGVDTNPFSSIASNDSTAAMAYGSPGDNANAKPPSAGPLIIATWNTPVDMAVPRCSVFCGTTAGSRAATAGLSKGSPDPDYEDRGEDLMRGEPACE